MAIEITVKDDSGKQVEVTVELENDQNWEEICYQVACKVAMEIATRWLKAMEERLFKERDTAIQGEKREWEDCFLRGKHPPPPRTRGQSTCAVYCCIQKLMECVCVFSERRTKLRNW